MYKPLDYHNMKKIYQRPQLLVLQMSTSDSILITQSDKKIPTESGGWVKENPIAAPHYNVWDNDWRDEEEKESEKW